MDIELIESFFKKLDEKLGKPAEIIITGAAAGALMGHIRPSTDIDFEIRLKLPNASEADRQDMANAIDQTSQEMKIAVNYSEDIAHWSMISYLDYRQTSNDHKTIGKLKIKVMAPEYWTVGKMGRFVELDIIDIKEIIKAKKLKPEYMIEVWAKALKESPMSVAKRDFKEHVIYFLAKHGRDVWGDRFDPAKSVESFKKLAGLV